MEIQDIHIYVPMYKFLIQCAAQHKFLLFSNLKVDIGNSVLVDSATLHRLKESNKAAGPFARALLNVVFNAEELEGRSLTGRKSNAFKDTPAKEALDPIRLNAVIGKIFYLFTYMCIH